MSTTCTCGVLDVVLVGNARVTGSGTGIGGGMAVPVPPLGSVVGPGNPGVGSEPRVKGEPTIWHIAPTVGILIPTPIR